MEYRIDVLFVALVKIINSSKLDMISYYDNNTTNLSLLPFT